MKRIVIMVAMAVLFLSVAVQSQAPVAKPGPEHKKLDIWVGDWTYEGEVKATPLGPAEKFSGKNSTKQILGGFYIEFRGEDKGPAGVVQWFEIDGYDPLIKKYTWNNFSSDGGGQTVTYTIEGQTVPYSGTQIFGGKQAKIRGTIVFSADFKTNIDKREVSVDGKTWMPLWELKAIKAKSSSK